MELLVLLPPAAVAVVAVDLDKEIYLELTAPVLLVVPVS